MIVVIFGLFVFACLCIYVQRNKYFPVLIESKPLKKVNDIANEAMVVNDISNQSNYYPQMNIIMKIFDYFNNGSEYRQNVRNFGFTPISVALDSNNEDDSGSDLEHEEIAPILGNNRIDDDDVCDGNIDFDGVKDEYASDIACMSSNESDEKHNGEDHENDITSYTIRKTEVQSKVQLDVESFNPMLNIR